MTRSNLSIRKFWPGWFALCIQLTAGLCASRVSAQGEGIFADFTTSMGSFTCRLEYAIAPKTVANFVGLATGERAWLDLSSGRVRTDGFYDGVTFHRVIAGFMSQSGSPNGQGTDGPGFAFADEFSASLRHDGFGVLSMANSGPDSNGSQFFITAAATPWLNDLHTVFGRVVGGSNVVHAINNVATGTGEKPLTNVVIHNIGIRRVGAAAQDFDIHAQHLPVVTDLPLQVARAGTNVHLNFFNRVYADNRVYSSTNLAHWTGSDLGIEVAVPTSNSVTRSGVAPAQFFRVAQIQYASSTFAPRNVLSRTMVLNFHGGSGIITINFDAVEGGSYTWSLGVPGTVTDYVWKQAPYNGKLWPIYYSGLIPMTLALNFKSAAAGTFSGTAYPDWPNSPFPVSGSFTLSAP
jgi:peptidyl-prolyl cis-trans isomerase A (cyclophilin A)